MPLRRRLFRGSSGRTGRQPCGRRRLSQRSIMIIPVRKSTIQGWESAIKFLQDVSILSRPFPPRGFHPAYLTGPDHPMTTARIFKPAKNAMQSGTAKTKEWQVDFEPEKPREIEPLMGWTSSSDMKQELSLRFDTKEEAVAYFERESIPYQVFEPKEPARPQAPHAHQFAFPRARPLTHLSPTP